MTNTLKISLKPNEKIYINGAVIRAAEEHGVPTPVTRTLANLVRMIEAG